MRSLITRLACCLLSCCTITITPLFAADDQILADFEGPDYGDWSLTGTAFGNKPARGTLPNQMPVSGYLGKGLVNTYFEGDGTTGTLTSPEFKIQHNYLTFLIGGGGQPHKTCINLLVKAKPVRTATGPNRDAGGSEELHSAHWDLSDLQGEMARIQIVDEATGGWGHINIDQIVLTDRSPPPPPQPAARDFLIASRYLLLPVKTGGPKRIGTLMLDNNELRRFEIELADGPPDWWAPLDVSRWKDKTLSLRIDKLPHNSSGLSQIRPSDKIEGDQPLYQEALRPQLHFSPRRGWTNDPNGLVHYRCQYHLFFQHNPYGWNWGNMHWGHAISRDLVHWEEVDEALYPDALGPMFSGSAVIDWDNTSGLGHKEPDGQTLPPMVLFYTAAGNPAVQCIAYSQDNGKTFIKYDKNPILKQITAGNRDPKVIWHPPTRQWIMVLYVELPPKEPIAPNTKPGPRHTIHFLTSKNLIDWTVTSIIEGYYECPDLFELPIEGQPDEKKWVLTAANSEYQIGSFDGKTFTPETEKLPGHRGRGFYAAQTYSNLPVTDGRRIQFGWLQAPSPGMPFNQSMSLPLELRLVSTSAGPRMTFTPARELDSLHAETTTATGFTLTPQAANPLDGWNSELADLTVIVSPEKASTLTLTLRGLPLVYHADRQELSFQGHKVQVPLIDGQLKLRVLVDRTATEIFAQNGQYYIPIPAIPAASNHIYALSIQGGSAAVQQLKWSRCNSCWLKPASNNPGKSK